MIEYDFLMQLPNEFENLTRGGVSKKTNPSFVLF